MRRRRFIVLLGGVATSWPLVARAQQSARVRRVGVLMGGVEGDPEEASWVAEFVQGLGKLGWTDGQNLRIEYRWGNGNASQARRYAAELVSLAPDAVLAEGATVLQALQKETRSVPIVFVRVSDPVGGGFVENVARPGAIPPGLPNSSTRSPENGWISSSRSRPA